MRVVQIIVIDETVGSRNLHVERKEKEIKIEQVVSDTDNGEEY